MLETLRKRRENEDEGFTLIELMVVILIIAILIAIAIPTFLGAQKRAKDRAAQSDLRNALSAGKTLATDWEGAFCASASSTPGSCNALDASDMFEEEGSLDFVNGATPADDSTAVAVTVADYTNAAGNNIGNGLLTLVRRSKSGNYYGLTANSDGGVKYCTNNDGTGSGGTAVSDGYPGDGEECPDTEW